MVPSKNAIKIPTSPRPVSSSEKKYRAAYQGGVEYPEPLEPTAHLVDFLSRYRPSGSSEAVDFGCGEGRDTLFLAKRGFRTIGLDSSPSAIRRAKVRALREKAEVQFRVADMTRRTIFRKDQFDLVINVDNIHALHRKGWRLSHFREAHRILKNGGFYFLCAHIAREPMKESAGVGSPRLNVSGERKKARFAYRSSFTGTAKGYEGELESSGFEILERKIGHTSPILARTCSIVARKPVERVG